VWHVEKFWTSSNFANVFPKYLFYQLWKLKLAGIIPSKYFFVEPPDNHWKNGLDSWEFSWERTSLLKMFIYNMIHDVSYQLVCDYFIHVLRTMLKNKISVYYLEKGKERAIFYDRAFSTVENQRTHTQQWIGRTFARISVVCSTRCKKSVRDCVSIGNSNTYCVANQKL
jgi:hypothetical protein